MNQDGLIDPNKDIQPDQEPKKMVKKKSDIIERKDHRIFTEDGKELLS